MCHYVGVVGGGAVGSQGEGCDRGKEVGRSCMRSLVLGGTVGGCGCGRVSRGRGRCGEVRHEIISSGRDSQGEGRGRVSRGQCRGVGRNCMKSRSLALGMIGTVKVRGVALWVWQGWKWEEAVWNH